VVKKIKDAALDSIYTEKKYTGIAFDNYETVIAGMRKAVTGGTCASANLPNIEVCAKTGTAQNKGKDHSIFIGFAPKDDPKVAFCILVENGGFGATNALPIARLMLEKYLNGEIYDWDKGTEERLKNLVILRNVLPKKQDME
jgi:penicillin-binding protein 2